MHRAELTAQLQSKLPPGLKIQKIDPIQDNQPSSHKQIIKSEYEVTLDESASKDVLEKRIGLLLAASELPRERQAKQYNLRPLIESLELACEEKTTVILMRLTTGEAATGRPEEVLLALGFDPHRAKIHRRRLFLEEEQSNLTPRQFSLAQILVIVMHGETMTGHFLVYEIHHPPLREF